MRRGSVLFIVMVMAVCLAQAGSALRANTLEINPSSDLQPGSTVNIHAIISWGNNEFPQQDKIEFYSQLERSSAHWEYAIGLNDKYPPVRTQGGQYLRIGGYELSYPASDYDVTVEVTLDGIVPTSQPSGEFTLLRVREVDSDDEVVGTEILKKTTIFNSKDLQAQIQQVQVRLSELKGDIEARTSEGIDTSEAQDLYTEAETALDRASTGTTGQAMNDLTSAENAINEGFTALERSWAQQTIDEAQQVIDSVIGLYNEFTVNRSLKLSDPRLVPITNKRDIAISSISNAKDQQATGSYASARAKAVDARTRADEAWNLSLDLKKELDSGFSFNFNLGGLLLPVAIVLLIVAVVGGIYYWKKYRTWDELG
jgi:hypothetical protein